MKGFRAACFIQKQYGFFCRHDILVDTSLASNSLVVELDWEPDAAEPDDCRGQARALQHVSGVTCHVSHVTGRHLVHVDGQLVEHHPEGGYCAVVVPAPVAQLPHLVPDQPQPDAEVRDHADRVEHHRQPGQSPGHGGTF